MAMSSGGRGGGGEGGTEELKPNAPRFRMKVLLLRVGRCISKALREGEKLSRVRSAPARSTVSGGLQARHCAALVSAAHS